MNKIFSFSLYKNAFKRIFTLTLIFTVVEAVVAVALSLTYMSMGDFVVQKSLYSFFTMNPLATTFMLVGVPILTVNVFSYLTNRAGADFYDALPHTRTSLAISGMTAVITAVFAAQTVSMLVSVFSTLLLCSDSIAVSFISVVVPYLAVTLASVLLSVICSLASFITGTRANALMVTFLIAAGPRILMAMFNSAILENLPLAVGGQVVPFFDNTYNLLTMLPLSSLISGSSITLKAFIYTLVLTVGYFVLAVFAYNKRKSEFAAHSAPGKIANHIYRISISSLFSLFGVTLVCTSGMNILSAVIFVLSIVLYFAYEIIANKSTKGLLSALKWLPVFILINVVFFVSVTIGAISFKSFSPKADDIDYVSVVSDDDSTYISLTQYAFIRAEDAKIEDEEVRKTVAAALSQNLEELKKGTYYITYSKGYRSIDVKINTSLGSRYRSIYISEEGYKKVIEALSDNSAYHSAWIDFPETPEIVTVNVDGVNITFTDEQTNDIYRTFRNEVKALGYDKWVEIYSESGYSAKCATVIFGVNDRGRTYYVSAYVPKSLKNTVNAIHDYSQTVTASQISDIRRVLQNPEEDLYINVTVYTGKDTYSFYGYYSEFENPKKATDFILDMMTSEYGYYDSDEPIIEVYVSELYGNGNYGVCCKLNTAINEDEIKEFFGE